MVDAPGPTIFFISEINFHGNRNVIKLCLSAWFIVGHLVFEIYEALIETGNVS
jgi:hypothetical protein